MKKGLVEMVFILDRSDSISMYDLEEDVIEGFNSRIEWEKGEKSRIESEKGYKVTVLVSTVLFADDSEVLHDRVEIEKVGPMTEEQYFGSMEEKQYFVGGSTALCDAIGDAIHHIGNVHKYMRDEDRPEKTIFVITTDGYENASRRYSADRVHEMMNRQEEKYGWKFIFYGAKINPVETDYQEAFLEGRSGHFHNFSYLSL